MLSLQHTCWYINGADRDNFWGKCAFDDPRMEFGTQSMSYERYLVIGQMQICNTGRIRSNLQHFLNGCNRWLFYLYFFKGQTCNGPIAKYIFHDILQLCANFKEIKQNCEFLNHVIATILMASKIVYPQKTKNLQNGIVDSASTYHT